MGLLGLQAQEILAAKELARYMHGTLEEALDRLATDHPEMMGVTDPPLPLHWYEEPEEPDPAAGT